MTGAVDNVAPREQPTTQNVRAGSNEQKTKGKKKTGE